MIESNELTAHILRSLIASYLGNIVGALFVGMPALYMYLWNYHFTDSQLGRLEAGRGSGSGSGNGTVHEVYQVESKQS